jgi:hexosaminidase
MLDVGRNFQPKQEILKVLDLMAFYKLNTFHLHFSEDEGWRVQMPSLPEPTEVGGRRGHTLDKVISSACLWFGPRHHRPAWLGLYTSKDFVEILKYANDRHISIIPEIETRGTRAAVKSMTARYEKYKKAGNMEEAERYLLHDVYDASRYQWYKCGMTT